MDYRPLTENEKKLLDFFLYIMYKNHMLSNLNVGQFYDRLQRGVPENMPKFLMEAVEKSTGVRRTV